MKKRLIALLVAILVLAFTSCGSSLGGPKRTGENTWNIGYEEFIDEAKAVFPLTSLEDLVYKVSKEGLKSAEDGKVSFKVTQKTSLNGVKLDSAYSFKVKDSKTDDSSIWAAGSKEGDKWSLDAKLENSSGKIADITLSGTFTQDGDLFSTLIESGTLNGTKLSPDSLSASYINDVISDLIFVSGAAQFDKGLNL